MRQLSTAQLAFGAAFVSSIIRAIGSLRKLVVSIGRTFARVLEVLKALCLSDLPARS
jgi:hypothetical protein